MVRIADGDAPKDLLTGIPKGAAGNTGSLIFTSPTTLVVQTGDAGDPGLANDPKSLAGKVIRIPANDRAQRNGCRRRDVP